MLKKLSTKAWPDHFPFRDAKAKLATGVLCLMATVLALSLERSVPMVGAPIFCLLSGLILSSLAIPRGAVLDQAGFVSQKLLQVSIVAIAATLNLADVAEIGRDSFLVMAGSLAAGMVFALCVGKWLGLSWAQRCMIGAGTSICGASAIAATGPAVGGKATEMANAIAVIFIFNILAIALFPMIGHALNLSDTAFGIWSGTAVNDTSAVAVVGYSFSAEAGETAIIVKLVRTIMILPVVLVLAYLTQMREGVADRRIVLPKLPLFIVLFVAASGLGSLGLVPFTAQVGEIGRFILLMALVSVGLQIRPDRLLDGSGTQFLLGGGAWLVVAATSLALLWLSGHW